MLRVRDYTRLKPDTKCDDGKIVACEYCGKPALLEESKGTKRFIHSETKGLDENNLHVLDWAQCPVLPPAKPPAKTPLG